ncbi:hypothetical protein PseAD21_07925 [Pseudomonas sp. AD21]|uniref:hypothetical protein n=1 Tax=Pseudomonas sp. AD21 TaxID=396378 RepID=UPI000C82BB73|nr:hypothetical protein [Pseudomonas sp. AD21]PMQ12527.1 hypothetical protein PseAD21_07925 [Pseudomonas sp. AD21]
MADLIYKQLEGMKLRFVSGELRRSDDDRVLSYAMTFQLDLDFTHFVHMSKQFIPGYLDGLVNAIRPELGGLAYHLAYNYFFDAAGNIHSSKALTDVFANPRYYLDEWATADFQHRYHKPVFQTVDGQLQITARRDYRWSDLRPIQIWDLPVIQFEWSLNLMEGHPFPGASLAPASVVILGYSSADEVDVGGISMRKGTRYMQGSSLQLGAIVEAQILTA